MSCIAIARSLFLDFSRLFDFLKKIIDFARLNAYNREIVLWTGCNTDTEMAFLCYEIRRTMTGFIRLLRGNCMGRRRDKLDKRREKQLKTRAANAPRKARERARKAAAAAAKVGE